MRRQGSGSIILENPIDVHVPIASVSLHTYTYSKYPSVLANPSWISLFLGNLDLLNIWVAFRMTSYIYWARPLFLSVLT